MLFNSWLDSGLTNENAILKKRPYIATEGRHRGQSVIAVNTFKRNSKGDFIYQEKLTNNEATLRKDEWIQYEEELIRAARERLVIIEDMRSSGLIYNAGDIGTVIVEWESASEMTDANISMDGETKATDKDRQQTKLHGVPIPIISKPYSIPARTLLASRRRGSSLDTTQGEEAAISVARTSEDIIFNGADIGFSMGHVTYNIPGLTTFTSRATAVSLDWGDDDNVTPEQIFQNIMQWVTQLKTQEKHYGPYKLYIPGDYEYRFREDYKANSDKTLEARVLEENSIEAIRVSDALSVGNILLIEFKKNVLDLALCQDLTNINWDSPSGMTHHFLHWAAWAPRFKTDYDGNCGILHATVGG